MFLKRHKPSRKAFTITELMVAVSLMSLIVFALYSMFNQVQKALRANESQIDSNERGRGVLELVSREIESARVGMRPAVTNLVVGMAAGTRRMQFDLNTPVAPGPDDFKVVPKTNAFDTIYYMTKEDKAWRGMGFAVLMPTNNGPREVLGPPRAALGTLYRYEAPNREWEYGFPTTNLFLNFLRTTPTILTPLPGWPDATNFSQVAEGIVHFRVKPYDPLGRPLAYNYPIVETNNPTYRINDPNYKVFRANAGNQNMGPMFSNSSETNANVILRQTFGGDPTETTAIFRSNALPAYIELELGVLEPETMRQYRQMVNDGMAQRADEYIQKRIAKVQIFRKRIPLRTVAQ